METYLAFLIKASAGIILFYLIYWISLRKETFYLTNRWFLLAALISSILIPLFPLNYTIQVQAESNPTLFEALGNKFKNGITVDQTQGLASNDLSWKETIPIVYLTGATLFLIRLLTQTFILMSIILKYRVRKQEEFRIVENGKYGFPFSFFNIVFINPKIHKQADLPEILAHEKVHIRERHWVDLLIIELLTVIFWFNPFIWFFERSIKQNHEYLADKGVLSLGHKVGRYQALLVNQLMGIQVIGVTNNLNFALNANRLKMMTKMKTPKIKKLKFTLVIPVLAFLLYAFAEPEYSQAGDENSEIRQKPVKGEFLIKGKVIRDDNGQALQDAIIVINGTTIGTVSNADGSFILTDPNPTKNEKSGNLTSTIVISHIGFETLKRTIDFKTESGTFSFRMKEGVIYIDPNIVNSPPPPPPPKEKSIQSNQALPKPEVISKSVELSSPSSEFGNKESKEIFTAVEELPQYPGGSAALGAYIYKMKKKLTDAKNCKGKAQIGFTVDQTGKVTNLKIINQDNKQAGKCAATIVMNMKDWSPGKQQGKPVPVNFIIPVEF